MRSSESSTEIACDVSLAPLTTLGIGGAARWLIRATDPSAVAFAHAWAADRGVSLFVLGGGSNLVIADAGVPGLVMQVAMVGLESSQEGDWTLLTAAAGEPWDGFVAHAVSRSLTGVECLSGIPGTVGGTPIQNVGAYGQEVSNTIARLTVFDRSEQRILRLSGSDCAFAYRMSRFKRADAGRFVVCDVTFRLTAATPAITYPDLIDELARRGVTSPAPGDVRDAVLAIRRRKGMVIDPADPDTRSVGSFFMNPVVDQVSFEAIARSHAHEHVPRYVMQNNQLKIPAAWLIERSGFPKGRIDGRVGLSTKHPLAIVNLGGATARDVLVFASRIKRAVLERFGVALRPEPVFVGFDADPDVEFLIGAEADQLI